MKTGAVADETPFPAAITVFLAEATRSSSLPARNRTCGTTHHKTYYSLLLYVVWEIEGFD